MNRSIRTLAFAAATLVGSASAFAAGPAAGEFSAADQLAVQTSAVETRAAVRHEALTQARAAHVVNGEMVEAYTSAPTELTRAAVRAEGRAALRAGTLGTGEAS